MGLTVRRSNPLEYAAPLTELMVANEHKTFDDFFERGYGDVVARGGACWLGFDEGGRVQMNVTLFRHDFSFCGRVLKAGMLGNMMASREHRTFFPMVSLVKQLVRDVKQEGELDFLYSDPNPGATAIMKGARLAHVGDLDRFVIPLDDDRWIQRIAARGYAAYVRLKLRGVGARMREHASAEFDASTFAIPEGDSPRLRPHHSDALYRRRLGGYPGKDYRWFEFDLGDGRAKGALLLHGPDDKGLAIVYAIRRAPDMPLAAMIAPVLARLQKQRAKRLQIEVVRETDLSRELQAIGFTQREDLVPVYAHPYTAAGAEAVQAISRWDITGFDMER